MSSSVLQARESSTAVNQPPVGTWLRFAQSAPPTSLAIVRSSYGKCRWPSLPSPQLGISIRRLEGEGLLNLEMAEPEWPSPGTFCSQRPVPSTGRSSSPGKEKLGSTQVCVCVCVCMSLGQPHSQTLLHKPVHLSPLLFVAALGLRWSVGFFSRSGKGGLHSSCSAWASHCSGFSSCRAQA